MRKHLKYSSASLVLALMLILTTSCGGQNGFKDESVAQQTGTSVDEQQSDTTDAESSDTESETTEAVSDNDNDNNGNGSDKEIEMPKIPI